MLFQPTAAADFPQIDSGDVGISLCITFHYDTDLVISGSSLPIIIDVKDQYGMPVSGATINILADGATATPSFGTTSSSGQFEFKYSASSTTEKRLLIVVEAQKDGTYGGIGRMVAAVTPEPGIGGIEIPVVPALGLSILASIGVAGTEYGRYSIFKFLVFPLYSRIKKDEVLDHFVRGQIFGYIRANPGVHFNLLKSDLNVNNGTLSHHLRTLEMQGFIKSKRDRMYKRFYPVDVKISSDDGIRLSDLQKKILKIVDTMNGASQTEIAKKLNVSQQTVSYNLRNMGRDGMILVENAGHERRYFIAS